MEPIKGTIISEHKKNSNIVEYCVKCKPSKYISNRCMSFEATKRDGFKVGDIIDIPIENRR